MYHPKNGCIVEGRITSVLPNGIYQVMIEDGAREVMAVLSKKLQTCFIHCKLHDRVSVRVPSDPVSDFSYDSIIVYRHKS